MARNQAAFDALVKSLRAGSFVGDRIDLSCKGLDDSDVEQLFAAFEENPQVAAQIKSLSLSFNQLGSVRIPTTLVALEVLGLYFSQLRGVIIPPTLVALKELHLSRNQLESVNIPPTLVALQVLYLDNNQLLSVNIPSTLVALKILYLEKNPLSSLARQQLAAMQHLWRECNIRFDNPVAEEPQISGDILTKWRETYFSPQLIFRNSLTSERAREAIRDITTVYLFLNKHGLPEALAPKIAQYLLPLPKRTDQSILAHSLLELFNMLPEDKRPSVEVLELLTKHEEALEQNIATAQELLAIEDARFAKNLATHPMYQRLLALNTWFTKNKSDIREKMPDPRQARPIAWAYGSLCPSLAYLATYGNPCTHQSALEDALSYGDDEVKAAAKLRLRLTNSGVV